jgi:CTP:molybdopterin cytidylyltransferase MocA
VVAGKNVSELEPIVDAHGAFTVVNPAPERGQFSSIQVGLRDVLNRGRDAAFLVPVDRPPVLPATVRDLRTAFLAADTDVWAVVPEVLQEGTPVHGHPILIGRELMEQFLRAPANSIARDIEHQHHNHIRYLHSQDARVAANIDTPEEYARLLRAEVVSADSAF